MFKDNQWLCFSQYVNTFGKTKVYDDLLTGEGSIELFIFGISTSLTHALHIPLIRKKKCRLPYCFTPMQSTCCCFPLLHSCVKGFACCLRGYNYKLNSKPLLSRASIVTFRRTVWEPQYTWLEGITNFKPSLLFYKWENISL